MASTVFQIETGTFALSMVDKAAVGYADDWQAPMGKTVDLVTLADYETASAQWSCQATSGALTTTPNVTNEDVPATFCGPASSIPVAAASSFSLDLSFLQDPIIVTGINRFLFENDTGEAYVFFGLNAMDPPKMTGRCRIVAGTIGGAARTSLTFDVSLPLMRKPDIEFGDATTSEVVNGDGSPPVARSASSRSSRSSKTDE